MRAARDCGHCCRIAEGTAERHGAKQRRIVRVECDATGHVSGMPRDGLLIVQNQFRSACGSRSGEGQTRYSADRLVRPGIGWVTFERQHRQSRKRVGTERCLRCKHTAQRGAIFLRERGENRWKFDRRESPLRHQRYRARSAQQAADLGCTKARVDMDGQRAKPGASEDSSQIVGAVRQPKRHASAGADAGLA